MPNQTPTHSMTIAMRLLGILIAISALSTNSLATENSDPIRVGIIGLDTSHAIRFTEIMNETQGEEPVARCEVVAAYPQGSTTIKSSYKRIPDYKKQVRQMGVTIVSSIPQLIEKVDAVLLETNDGQPRLRQALPVIEAGLPLFVDKPVAASLADVVAIFHAAKTNDLPIFTASALRYMKGMSAVRQREIGPITGANIFSPGATQPDHPDLYWYGIHGVGPLFAIMGPGCETVRRVHTEGTDVVVGQWADGRIGTFRARRRGQHSYGGIAFGEEGEKKLGSFAGYDPLVRRIAKFFATGQAPVRRQEMLEIYAFMSAADVSKQRGGASVSIDRMLHQARQKAMQRLKQLRNH